MKKYLLMGLISFNLIGCGGESSTGESSVNTTGQAGSMARFALSDNYLYTLNYQEMNVFDVSNASKPTKVSKIHVPFDVETLFSYQQYLYVGASSGIYIYDKNIPTQPTRISEFTHAQSCDPVVVSQDIAFVTLNTGRNCWNNRTGVNRLEIINVKDVENPTLIQAVDMWEPSGLAIDNSTLFICDGDSGLKIFDVNKTEEDSNITVAINLKGQEESIDCYDLIAYQKTLIVSNKKDIRQFDYTSFPMQELGQIK